MTKASEIAEGGYASQQALKQSKLTWGLTVVSLMLRNPVAFKKLIVIGPDEPRYVRPPRAYELPEYREGMEHCTSNEKYLRPTRWCNPREPLLVAMAHELGAYKLSDWEFAEAAYWWIKTNIRSELRPLDSVSATLRRGTGTCIHATCLWIALCRAAGIKARYKEFKTMMDDVAMQLDVVDLMDLGEAEQAMIPSVLNTETAVLEGEACLGGRWVVADVGDTPELLAQYGSPILKVGEDAMDLVVTPIPDATVKHLESVPLMSGIALRAMRWFTPVMMERANVIHAAPIGRKIIEEAGGLEAYDQKARAKKGKLVVTEEITEEITRLTRAAERKQAVVFKD